MNLDYKVNYKEYDFPINENYNNKFEGRSVIYILNNEKLNNIYIGETDSFRKRMKDHEKSKGIYGFNKVYIFYGNKITQGTTFVLESSLLRLIEADGKYSREDIINSRLNQTITSGLEKQIQYLTNNTWNKMFELGLVNTKRVEEVRNSLMFKYSTFIELDKNQSEILTATIDCIKDHEKTIHEIIGGAGTGKSVLTTILIDTLIKENVYKQEEIALYIPQVPNLEKFKRLFKQLNLNNVNFVRGKDLVNQQYKLLVVDEAHRIKQYFPKQANVLNYLKNSDDSFTHDLEYIMKNNQHIILLMDEFQAIRPSDLRVSDISEFINRNISVTKHKHETFHLNDQHRIEGGNDYIRFIQDFLGLSKSNQSNYDFEDYNFEISTNVLQMHNELKSLHEDIGLSLLSSGFYEPWATKIINPPSKRRELFRKGEVSDFNFNDYKLIWNSTDKDWASKEYAKNEVGSVFTLQGADLNYCGVIIGNDIYFDPKTNRLEVDEKNICDKNAIPIELRKDQLDNGLLVQQRYELLRENIINAYYVLLTRGIKGTYVYFVDQKTREYFEKFYARIINN